MKTIRECVKENGDHWRAWAPAAYWRQREYAESNYDAIIMGSKAMRSALLAIDVLRSSVEELKT